MINYNSGGHAMISQFKAGEILALQGALFTRLITLLEERQYTDKAYELQARLRALQAQEKIRIAFVGQFSAGKSSMISALTGKAIDTGTDVTTEVCTDYPWGSFILTDTPGLQNNQHHDELATAAIKKSDLIIYCITYELFNQNTLSDYLQLAYDKGYKGKMILVINKVNSEEAENRDELINNYIESLNKALYPHALSDVPYCFIDVADYQKGKEKNKERRIIRSNFPQFIDILNDFLATNGLLCKMDTPLRIASDIVNAVRIDESETDEDRQKRIVISRLNRDFQVLRSEASRNWNGEVNRELADFSDRAYTLFARIQTGECNNPAEEFDVLLNQTLNTLNETLSVFSQKYEDECNEKADEILASGVAKRLFDDISVETSDKQKQFIDGGRYEAPQSGNHIVREGVSELGQKIVVHGSKVSQEGVKKVILDIGHKFGHKFKPWGATKLASKATKAIKCVGPALEVFSFIIDVKDTIDENQAAKRQQQARVNLYHTLEDTKNAIKKACDAQRAEFIRTVFDTRLEALSDIEHQMASVNTSNHDFNVSLSQIEEGIKSLQAMILSSAIIDE